jgi:hypothetical protein
MNQASNLNHITLQLPYQFRYLMFFCTHRLGTLTASRQLSAPACCQLHGTFLLGLLFDSEDGGICCYEMSVNFHETSRSYIPEDRTIHLHLLQTVKQTSQRPEADILPQRVCVKYKHSKICLNSSIWLMLPSVYTTSLVLDLVSGHRDSLFRFGPVTWLFIWGQRQSPVSETLF